MTLVGGDGYDILQTSMLINEGIVKGRIYRFRYRCQNITGWSAWSDETYIKAAIAPGIPAAPTLISADSNSIAL